MPAVYPIFFVTALIKQAAEPEPHLIFAKKEIKYVPQQC